MQAADLYLLRQVVDCVLHPDGRRVVYAVSGADEKTDSYRQQLWLHDGDIARPVTEVHSAHSPRFSPDGRWLAYIAHEHKKPGVLKVLNLGGGEPVALATFDDGVGEPVWLPNSSGLVVAAPTRDAEQKGKTREQLADKPRPRHIESTQYRFNGRGWINDRRIHLFLVLLPEPGGVTPEAVQLTDGSQDDTDPAVSPDGATLAFVSARHADAEWVGGNTVWTIALATQRSAESVAPTVSESVTDDSDAHPVLAQPVAMTNSGSWSSPRFATDGHLVAVGRSDRGRISLYHPYVIDGLSPKPIGGDDGAMAGGFLTRGRNVYGIVARRGATHVERTNLDTGETSTVIGGRRQVWAFDVSADERRVVAAVTGSNTPSELIEVVDGRERLLTSHTAAFLAEVEPFPVDDIEFAAEDGYPVHALIVRPSTPGPHPALVYVHGGPLAQYGYGFFDEFQMAAAHGYVVIGANPRGSDGYGLEHARSIEGRMGTVDWLDVTATADALAALAYVDAERIGIGGGSYGGFMAAWATGHTDRFKAALVERAVINWATMEATSDIGWFVRHNLQADTLTNAESIRQQSPITYAPNVRTPTLVLHSDEDWRCPPEQGEQWYAALRRNGVEVEYVRFPGENHELTRNGRPTFRIARFEIVHNFFAKHIV
jgi:dipeptidyl aminopeptidase/acylaminoacyl peptidase